MKKYITLAALLAAGTACANAEDIVTLRYLLDFNTLPSSGGLSLANGAIAPGDTSATAVGFVNYTTGTMDGSDYAHPGNSSNWKIESSSGLNDGNNGVLSSTSGFTIVFNGYAGSSNWGDFISFTVGSESYKFEINDGNGLNIYTATTQSTSAATVEGVSRDTWYNYAISVSGTNYALTVVDTSGKVVGTEKFSGVEGNLTLIQDISSFEMHNKSDYKIDNVAVYDGVLSSENLVALTKSQVEGNGTIQVIPEPSAFGMLAGLGALALVASRRRRK